MGQCRSKTVTPVYSSPDSAMDSAFLGAIGTNQEPTWKMKLQLSGPKTEFKLDMGAEVTAISDQTFQGIAGCQLTAPSKKLYGPARTALEVIGKFEGTIAYQERTSKQTIYVVKGLRTNLLGFPAIVSLNLVAHLGAATVGNLEVLEEFSSLFEGLGNLGEPYDIKLKPDVKPYALFTPRNIPLPLQPKVEEELRRMEELGVISKVNVPTPWCAEIVTFPK